MDIHDVKQKAESFFKWPNKNDRHYITYESAMLFAWDCVKDVTEKPMPLKDKFTTGLQCQVAKIQELEAEIHHWKANHADLKNRLAVVQTRPDLPLDRLAIYDRFSEQVRSLREALHRIADPEDNADPQLIAEKALAESV